MRILFGLFISLVVLSSCSKALPPIEVQDAFVFELPPDEQSLVVHMNIKNNSDVVQPLNYVHSPIAGYAEVHRTFYMDGKHTMRQVGRMKVAPSEVKQLSPQGFHIMLFDVYDPIEAGDKFEITLEFETGHVVTPVVEVRSRS